VFGPTYGSSKVKTKGQDEHEEEEMLSYPGVALGVTKQQSGSTRGGLERSFITSTRTDRQEFLFTGSRLNRIILTPLPSPPNVPVDQAWLHPILSSSPPIASGDLRLADIIVLTFPLLVLRKTFEYKTHSLREDCAARSDQSQTLFNHSTFPFCCRGGDRTGGIEYWGNDE